MRPLPEDRKEIQHASSVMMVGQKEFLKTLKVKNTPWFAIVVKPKLGEKGKEGISNERIVGPKEVRQLLDKYKEVISDCTKGKYTNLMMRKMGPFKILQKYGTNAYKLEFPTDIGLSNIFNVCDLYPYKGTVDCDTGQMDGVEVTMIRHFK